MTWLWRRLREGDLIALGKGAPSAQPKRERLAKRRARFRHSGAREDKQICLPLEGRNSSGLSDGQRGGATRDRSWPNGGKSATTPSDAIDLLRQVSMFARAAPPEPAPGHLCSLPATNWARRLR